MTILAPDRATGMSVVGPTFNTQKEVKQMTTAIATAAATELEFLLSATRDGVNPRSRPSVLNRAIMRLSVAMLRWARNHADRPLRTWDELSLSNRNALEREARANVPIPGRQRLI